jgi:hypothetical protein
MPTSPRAGERHVTDGAPPRGDGVGEIHRRGRRAARAVPRVPAGQAAEHSTDGATAVEPRGTSNRSPYLVAVLDCHHRCDQRAYPQKAVRVVRRPTARVQGLGRESRCRSSRAADSIRSRNTDADRASGSTRPRQLRRRRRVMSLTMSCDIFPEPSTSRCVRSRSNNNSDSSASARTRSRPRAC